MAEPIPEEEKSNYETFRECLSEPVLKALAMPAEAPRKKRVKRRKGKEIVSRTTATVEPTEQEVPINSTDAEELGEFIEYLSSLIFPSLPPDLRTLTHTKFKSSPTLQSRYSSPLPPATATHLLNTLPPTALDSLTSYSLLPPNPDMLDLTHLLTPLYTSYITATTSAPPVWTTTRTPACELCARDWIPLTYHHLIPKSVHERVRKRAWHPDEMLNAVAWLCRACHSFVHRLAGNEELARRFWSVELIKRGGEGGERRGEVEGWVRWVGGVRWKSR